MHLDAKPLTPEFNICGLVRILKATPAADVVDEDCFVFSLSVHDIVQELLDCIPAGQAEPAFSFVRIKLHNVESLCLRVVADHLELMSGE